MTELLTAARMRAIEQAAIATGEVSGLDLMERAGRGVIEAVFEEWPDLAAGPFRAVVLCGPGNNGGDGFVVARLLKGWGWEVAVFLYGDPDRLPPDARANYERWMAMGKVRALGFPDLRREDRAPLVDAIGRESGTALVVDAIFGTGFARPAPGLAMLHEICAAEMQGPGPRRVAVDVPTGMCADSGRPLGAAPAGSAHAVMCCHLAVTFHRPRQGHHVGQGPEFCGKVAVADIGLDPRAPAGRGPAPGPATRAMPQAARLAAFRGGLAEKRSGHKYAHGHALIVSGGPGRTGAARLAARGALRIGAGLVTLAVPPAAQQEAAAQVTAIMLRRVANGERLAALLEDARFNALCLGPGLGLDDKASALVAAALESRRATVLDADALTLIAADATLFAALHETCILTPHGGEFARLFPDIAQRLDDAPGRGPAFSKVDATRAAARRAGCVVVFKGPDTVIAAPDGGCFVSSAHYERAAPWLATAGSGDVLSGFAAGLLARGLAPMRAAESAAWLHVECARRFGPGLIAEDLPEQLPALLRALGL